MRYHESLLFMYIISTYNFDVTFLTILYEIVRIKVNDWLGTYLHCTFVV